MDSDANHGSTSAWENVFHDRKKFFETATGNKETGKYHNFSDFACQF